MLLAQGPGFLFLVTIRTKILVTNITNYRAQDSFSCVENYFSLKENNFPCVTTNGPTYYDRGALLLRPKGP